MSFNNLKKYSGTYLLAENLDTPNKFAGSGI